MISDKYIQRAVIRFEKYKRSGKKEEQNKTIIEMKVMPEQQKAK